MIKNKVSVIGLGYVGLPLALTIAEAKKYEVCGFDISDNTVSSIQKKSPHIKDPYINDLINKVEIKVSTDIQVIKQSQYIIVCVPTPVQENKLPNLTPLKSAAKTISDQLEKGQHIIIESTVNPGVCEEVLLPILEESGLKGGIDFELSHCPERINPGDKKWTIKNIPRNIGSITIKGNHTVAEFYRSFLDGKIQELTSLKTSEASKVIENTFRDINIAYVNELAKSFDLMGIDLVEVINAASSKPFAFLPHFPSCGVGGHCIPVDPYYLIERAKDAGFDHSFLRKAREVNLSMPSYTVQLLEQKLEELNLSLENTPIGLLGLSYKGNVSDLRESPSLVIESILKTKKTNLKTFDPHILEKSTSKSLEEILDFAQVIILATDHDEFKSLNSKKLSEKNIKIVIDGKNCLNKKDFLSSKIIYKGIGR